MFCTRKSCSLNFDEIDPRLNSVKKIQSFHIFEFYFWYEIHYYLTSGYKNIYQKIYSHITFMVIKQLYEEQNIFVCNKHKVSKKSIKKRLFVLWSLFVKVSLFKFHSILELFDRIVLQNITIPLKVQLNCQITL